MRYYFIVLISLLLDVVANGEEVSVSQPPVNASYQEDFDFVRQFDKPIELVSKDGQSRALLSEKYQARVLTSAAFGSKGQSNGWFSYDAIREQRAGVGGEDRFWLTPMGSQFSVFFKAGDKFVEGNWHIHKSVGAEAYPLIKKNRTEAHFSKNFDIVNHAGTRLQASLQRRIRLLEKNAIERELSITIPKKISFVAFESQNTLANTGDHWKPETGMLGPWVLGTFKGTDHSTFFARIKMSKANPLEVQRYLFPLEKDRLHVHDGTVYMKVDGRYRSKIGLRAANVIPRMAVYESSIKRLTIVQFYYQSGSYYPSGRRGPQTSPYAGDVINIYNHGSMDGTLLRQAAFYELESSSALLPLKTGEYVNHRHQTFHFFGKPEVLNGIAQTVMGVSLTVVKQAF